MKRQLLFLLITFIAIDLWSQVEVKVSTPGLYGGEIRPLNVEFIKNEHRGVELLWTTDLRSNYRHHDLFVGIKKYPSSKSGADTWFYSPFIHLGLAYNKSFDPKINLIKGSLGFAFGYKHVFKNGIVLEPLINLGLGAIYGFPIVGGPSIPARHRTSLLIEPRFRINLGYRFNRKKLVVGEELDKGNIVK